MATRWQWPKEHDLLKPISVLKRPVLLCPYLTYHQYHLKWKEIWLIDWILKLIVHFENLRVLSIDKSLWYENT